MQMKIAYLVPEFPAQTHAFFWREILGMRASGCEVRLFSTRTPAEKDKGTHAFLSHAREETTYLYPPLWGTILKSILKHPLWCVSALKYVATLEGLDIRGRIKSLGLVLLAASLLDTLLCNEIYHIHGHSCADTAHILAMCGLHPDVTYSLTLHGNLSVYGKNHRHKMSGAAFVSPVTKPLQLELEREAGVSSERAPVIWMGVDMSQFQAQPVPEVSEQFELITVARLNPVKGHTFGLQAVQELLNRGIPTRYTIVGGGEMREELEREVAARGLDESVTFTGSLGEEAIASLLERSHALLLSSFGLGEAAPVCVMEAMASGRPVISSIIGGTRDMIIHGETGFLVEQKDVEAIAACVEKLSKDHELRTRIGRAARAFAEKHFDSQKQAKKLLMAIEGSLGTHRGA